MSPREWPTEKLVSECLAERPRAWDELVRRFGPVIHGAIRKQLRRFGFASREDLIADAYQEVFVTLTRGKLLTRLQKPDALPGYLAAIAISKAVDAMRGISRDGSYLEWSSEQSVSADPGDADGAREMSETACPNPNPHDSAARQDVCDVIEREIGDLPEREALVVRLKWQNEMTLEGIAQQLQLPAGTVASVLRRTRDQVRTRLAEKGITG